MQTVFCVWSFIAYEGSHLKGVFSTMEKAETYLAAFEDNLEEWDNWTSYCVTEEKVL